MPTGFPIHTNEMENFLHKNLIITNHPSDSAHIGTAILIISIIHKTPIIFRTPFSQTSCINANCSDFDISIRVVYFASRLSLEWNDYNNFTSKF